MREKLRSIIGSNNTYSLGTIIFHTICITLVFIGTISVFINYLMGLPLILVYLSSTVAFVPAILLYLSRFRGYEQLAKNLFIVLAYLLVIFFWFFNSGINGIVFILFLLLLIWQIVFNSNKKLLWLVVNVGVYISLLVLSYYKPNLIIDSYISERVRYFDFGFTYLVGGISSFFIINSLLVNYQRERIDGLKKNQELMESNSELIRTVEELEYVNKTKDKLFTIVSHDIRSSVGNILNFSNLLIDHENDITEKSDKLFKNQIYKSSKNLDELLKNLLSWAQLQMDSITASIESHNLFAIINKSYSFYKHAFNEKQISVVLDIDVGYMVEADSEMLASICRNIISNALKFTEPSGCFAIKSSVDIKSNMIVISFSDNGVGMDQIKVDRIKDKLSLGSERGTNNEKGSGLGISIINEFISKMNGRIEIESEVNQGTTILVFLERSK